MSLGLAKINKAEAYNELGFDELGSSLHKKDDETKKRWWNSFAKEQLTSDSIQLNNYDLSSKYESVTIRGKKRKKSKSTASILGNANILTKVQKRRIRQTFTAFSNIRYRTFLPLKEMWMMYIEDLIKFKSLTKESLPLAAQKMMKADFHGCPIRVVQSKCPSYVGTFGIVIKETKNTFVLATPEDIVKCIPKTNSIFSVVVHGYAFTIHGNQFAIRPGERAARKFKSKATTDL